MLNRFEQFSSSIFSIYQCIQKIERDEMVRYGLKGACVHYLTVISRCREGITAARLCELCDKDKAAVSRAVADMEQKGLLIREGDSYRARLKLTEAGEEAARYVRKRAVVAVELAGKGLTDEDRVVFYATLERIASNLQTISRDGMPECEEQEG